MRSLDTMILDEMIEQYRRFNPAPQYDESERPTLREHMESEMLVSLLTELQALRPRCGLYETRIVHLNRDVQNLLIENANLKRALGKAVGPELAQKIAEEGNENVKV